MSKIYAKNNTKTNNWVLDTTELGSFYNNLYIGFTNEEEIVDLRNIRFGFELKQGENIKQYGVFPPSNIKYIKTNQKYIVVVALRTIPKETYELYLWSENNNTLTEETFVFTIPQPKKPFSSWVWKEQKMNWEAPIPYPDDNKEYIWNEAEQEWTYTGYYFEDGEMKKEEITEE
jgi:hypothetical protein